MNKIRLAVAAQEALRIQERGWYRLPSGQTVSIQKAQSAACAGTQLFLPDDYPTLWEALEPTEGTTTTSVESLTTLEAARQLTARFARVGLLNFASAKNPGGGFLGGARAQEESLARASGLYATLRTQPEFYAFHRELRTCLYSDRVIYSPDVPVFCDDNHQALSEPWTVSMLTAAAVNVGALERNEPEKLSLVRAVMARRIRLVLAVAASQKLDALVLGAWGCGVFRCDPELIAALFKELLLMKKDTPFKSTPPWDLLQTAFLVIMVVPSISGRGQAIDAEHARNAALFSLGSFLVGAIGLIWVSIQRKKSKAISLEAPPVSDPNLIFDDTEASQAPNPNLVIAYDNVRESMWRCEKFSLFRRPEGLGGLLLLGSVVGIALAQLGSEKLGVSMALLAVPSIPLGVMLWGGFMLGMISLTIPQMLARTGGKRRIVWSITPEGLIRQRPEGTSQLAWKSIKGLQWHQGDHYFRYGVLGTYTPVEAFGSEEESRRYFDLIQALVQSNGARWDELTRSRDSS